MIIVGEILVSEEIIGNKFVCDLAKCKGGCCQNGAAGAPLEEDEVGIIAEIYETIKPYLTNNAVNEIEKIGLSVSFEDYKNVTPSLENDSKLCVYGYREKGIIKCAFEQAYNDGKTKWKKPISCHLFPIRIKNETMNYEPRETLCNPACALGEKLQVKVFEFLKEPIIRKYGEVFYEQLKQVNNGGNI